MASGSASTATPTGASWRPGQSRTPTGSSGRSRRADYKLPLLLRDGRPGRAGLRPRHAGIGDPGSFLLYTTLAGVARSVNWHADAFSSGRVRQPLPAWPE